MHSSSIIFSRKKSNPLLSKNFPSNTPLFVFFLGVGVSLGRASGKKCFLNLIGFKTFFECFPNHYAKDFVGVGKIQRPQIYLDFDTFFSMKSAVKMFFNKISSGVGIKLGGQIFFNEISSGNFFRFFFNEITSGNCFRVFSMKSSVQMFFEFFSMNSAVEFF